MGPERYNGFPAVCQQAQHDQEMNDKKRFKQK